MAYEADKVVVELVAKVDGFDQPIKQSATQFDAAAKKMGTSAKGVEDAALHMSAAQFKAAGGIDGLAKSFERAAPAADRAEKSLRGAQQASRNLGYQISDVGTQLSMGTNPFIILAQQGPQVANALDGAKGGLGRFATFLSGPWGAALLGAGTLLGVFLSKNREAAESVDDLVDKLKKHYEQTKLSDQAHKAFDATIEGSIAKIDALTESLKKQNLTLEDNINLAKAAAAVALTNVLGNISAISTQLAAAVQRYESAKKALQEAESGNFGSSTEAASAVGAARAQVVNAREEVTTLTGQLSALTKAATDGSKALNTVAAGLPLIEQRAKDAVDPISRINHEFDDMATKAKRAGTYTQAFATNLEKQRKAALDAAEATKKANNEFGKQISFDDAAAIAKGAGLNVTSAYRSTAHQAKLYNNPAVNRPGNPVARPGSSAHEGVNGKWALDIAFAPGLTPNSLKKLYGDQGVTLSAVYKEKGHFHIEGSRSQAAAEDNAAARAAREEAANEQAYQNEKASLDAQILNARQQLAVSAETVTGIQLQVVDIAHDKYADEVRYREETGKLHSDEAKTLLDLNDQRAKLLKEAIQRVADERAFREQEAAYRRAGDFQQASAEAEADALKSEEALATTAKQRHDIEERLIQLAFQEEKLREQYIIDWAARVQANANATDQEKADAAAQATNAQMHLDTLGQRRSNALGANDRQNAGPLASFLDQIPHEADQINEAFESFAANGLASFASGIADAAVNFKSLGDVGLSILKQLEAALIEMAVRQLFAKALGGLFSGLGGGLGKSLYPVVNGVDPLAPLPGRASGGPVSSGSAYVVGENGPELFIPQSSGSIVPNNARAAPASAGGAQSLVVVHVEASEYFDGRVVKVAGPVIAQASVRAANGGSVLARQAMQRSAMHQLD